MLDCVFLILSAYECRSFNETNDRIKYIMYTYTSIKVANRMTNLSNFELSTFHAFQWLYKSWSFNSITISSTSANAFCVRITSFSSFHSACRYLLPQSISFSLFSLRYAHALHSAPYLWLNVSRQMYVNLDKLLAPNR